MAKGIKMQLKEIAEAAELTDKQRSFIVSQSETMGVKFNPYKTTCGDCYRDQAIILWRLIAEQEAQESTTRKYLLRAGIDVIWRGVRVNATLTDKELAELLKAGFPQNYFIRINGEDGRWL